MSVIVTAKFKSKLLDEFFYKEENPTAVRIK